MAVATEKPVAFDHARRAPARFAIGGACWTVAAFANATVGSVLVVAALLKLNSFVLAGPTSGTSSFLSTTPTALLTTFELTMGLLIALGKPNRLVFWVAVVCFAAFGAYNAIQAVRGSETCQCFGTLSMHSWVAFWVDLYCLAGLVAARAVSAGGSPQGRFLSWNRQSTLVAAGCFAFVVACAALPWIPGAAGVLARSRGEGVRLAVPDVVVPRSQSAQPQPVDVQITNWWKEPVVIVGGYYHCACRPIEDLPVRVDPLARRSIRVVVRVPQLPGTYTVPIELYTDSGSQPRATGHVTVEVVDSPQQNDRPS